MFIKTILISGINRYHNKDYIAYALLKADIAKVMSITLRPYVSGQRLYNEAHIIIDEWCDTEVAYNFIQRLKKTEGEARLVHSGEYWWPVQKGCMSYSIGFENAFNNFQEIEAKEENDRMREIERFNDKVREASKVKNKTAENMTNVSE